MQSDLAKAKRANVDTGVLGVPLGQRLTMPTCASAGINPREAKGGQLLTGSGLGELTEVLGALTGEKPSDADRYQGNINACLYTEGGHESVLWLRMPGWVVMAESVVRGHVLMGGRLIVRETNDLFKQLLRKYGKPSSMEKSTFQNTYGARSEREAYEWSLPGLHVSYSPRAGDMSNPAGDLVIELEAEQKFQQRREAEQDQAAPKL